MYRSYVGFQTNLGALIASLIDIQLFQSRSCELFTVSLIIVVYRHSAVRPEVRNICDCCCWRDAGNATLNTYDKTASAIYLSMQQTNRGQLAVIA